MIGNVVYETQYDDTPNAKHPQRTFFYHVDDKQVKKRHPEIVAWAESVRNKLPTNES